jgi:hypothetical protein
MNYVWTAETLKIFSSQISERLSHVELDELAGAAIGARTWPHSRLAPLRSETQGPSVWGAKTPTLINAAIAHSR